MVAEKKKEYLRVVIRIWNRNRCIVGRLRESQGDVAYDMDEVVVRLDTSLAPAQVLTSILVGILVGNPTRGSESPVPTGYRGSEFGFWADKYPRQVLASTCIYFVYFIYIYFCINYSALRHCGIARQV
jgi:hypothetical protein